MQHIHSSCKLIHHQLHQMKAPTNHGLIPCFNIHATPHLYESSSIYYYQEQMFLSIAKDLKHICVTENKLPLNLYCSIDSMILQG